MTTDTYEAALRDSLRQRAQCVDNGTCATVRGSEFHPSTRPPGLTAAALGLVLVLVAVVVAGLLVAGSTSPAHRSVEGLSGPTIRLATLTIRLPAGAHVVSASSSRAGTCAPKAPPVPGTPETVTQAGGVFATLDGGCLNTNLGPTAVPNAAQPTVVGTYMGFVNTDAAGDVLTLYVDVFTNHDLIFTATQTSLHADELIALAVSGMPPCSPDRDAAAACATGGQ